MESSFSASFTIIFDLVLDFFVFSKLSLHLPLGDAGAFVALFKCVMGDAAYFTSLCL